MVRPSRRAGVPVLKPAHAKTQAVEALAQRNRRLFPHPARWSARLAHVDQAVEECSRSNDHCARTQLASAGRDHARRCTVLHQQILDRLRNRLKIGLFADRGQHMPPVKLAIGLSARSLHGRPLGAVQHAELDAGLVDHAAHEPIERIDFAHKVAFAEPANGRIARHFTDGFKLVGDQRGTCTHARSRSRSLAARVPGPNHNDVKAFHIWVSANFSKGRAALLYISLRI